MEELIKLVAKQAGLSDDVAEKGVGMVAGFLQGQLPPAAGAQIGEVLGAIPSTATKDVKTTGDLVKLISKQTGVSGDVAEKVLEVVLGYLKKNLPEPLAGAVDMLLGGAGSAGGAGLGDLLGGMLGR